ncbi:MAG: thioredoxin-dependent thiol peroxidase [Actinomycetota bacterium]|nr:thioredoxin-dependent thiol peroxidase [Actinomycetota bacterium]MDP9019584.1 thioredoxin-dependent thiol peroxidase [Actinomycetota bacterium]
MLVPGDRAPAFTLPDQRGEKVRLTDFRGRKVLVFFYPKANTPGCTTQASGLRDALPDLGGVAVLGVSPDAPEAQAAFDQEFGLGFPLLSDPQHRVAEMYGAWGEKKMYGRSYQGVIRSAFLVDENGRVAEAWYRISPKDTAKKVLRAVSDR